MSASLSWKIVPPGSESRPAFPASWRLSAQAPNRKLCGGRLTMVASGTGVRFEEIAQDLFGIITQFCLVVTRGRRRAGDLKEAEFLTLAILHERGTMIVG